MAASRTSRSIRRGMALMTMVPLLVFSLLLALVMVSGAERLRVISDFVQVLGMAPALDELRHAANERFDHHLLGEMVPADSARFESATAAVIDVCKTRDMGRFNPFRNYACRVAQRIHVLDSRFAEARSAGRSLTRDLQNQYDAVLLELRLHHWRISAAYRFQRLPLDNAKWFFVLSHDLETFLYSIRRQMTRALQKGVLSRAEAVELNRVFGSMDQFLARFAAVENDPHWPPMSEYVDRVAAAVQSFLLQPEVQQVRDQGIPVALEKGTYMLSAPEFPDATVWYRDQSRYWDQYAAASLWGLEQADDVAQRQILLELALYIGLISGLVAAIGFSLFRARRFGDSLVTSISGLSQRLEKIGETGDLSLRVDTPPEEELGRIVSSVNVMLENLQAAQAQVSRLLEESATHNAELQEYSAELGKRNLLVERQTDKLRTANEEIRRHAAEVEEASRVKSEFLANMSHELRTPLNSMLILSQMLKENGMGHLDADEVESARIIHDSGQSLLDLINDILDLSKVEAGKIEVAKEPLKLRVFADMLYKRYQPMAGERGLFFEMRFGDGLPETVETDPKRLSQIVTNLLSNGMKFTHEGGVTLRFSPHDAGDGNSRLAIAVTDTGIGIASDQRDKIFHAFEQADGAINRDYGGTGLGLTLSRKLARLLGGDLVMESEKGKGSTFTLTVPMD